MKKILIGILSAVAIIAILIGGKIQMDKYRVKSIVHGEEGKAAIENMLRVLDEKALTPEGKIKSYKINYNKIKRNPMGGISIEIIINDNDSLRLGTIINKYNKDVGYEFGALSLSPGLSKLIRGE